MPTIKPLIDFVVANKGTFAAVGGTAGAVLSLFKLYPKAERLLIAHWDKRLLKKRRGAEAYTPDEIWGATEFYIQPDCQDVDPGGGEDWRRVHAVRQNAFKKIDQILDGQAEFRHTIVLADSGMGKTSLVLNYYARHHRKRYHPFELAVVPLGHPRADELLGNIKDPGNTVLFLDAFDEDTKAIQGHKARLADLMKRSEPFRHVLVTCRTQFFLADEEIPKETGILRFGVTAAGQSKSYEFNKIYLSPFSDEQVRLYLRNRFPFWKRRDRKAAEAVCAEMSDLTVRPMLLTYVPDLISSGSKYRYSFEIYEEMIRKWVDREKPLIPDGEALIQFSEELALNIFTERERRSSETISMKELMPLAERYGIQIEGWQLSGRSLLNRTADGRRKFAHRSIMEYLVIQRFFRSPPGDFPYIRATDQMSRFFWEKFQGFTPQKMEEFEPNLHRLRPKRPPADLGIAIDFDPPQLQALRQRANRVLLSGFSRSTPLDLAKRLGLPVEWFPDEGSLDRRVVHLLAMGSPWIRSDFNSGSSVLTWSIPDPTEAEVGFLLSVAIGLRLWNSRDWTLVRGNRDVLRMTSPLYRYD